MAFPKTVDIEIKVNTFSFIIYKLENSMIKKNIMDIFIKSIQFKDITFFYNVCQITPITLSLEPIIQII